jgi:hypothetical protein
MTMKLGVTMPRTAADGGPLTGESFADIARTVERVGLDGL